MFVYVCMYVREGEGEGNRGVGKGRMAQINDQKGRKKNEESRCLP